MMKNWDKQINFRPDKDSNEFQIRNFLKSESQVQQNDSTYETKARHHEWR